MVTWYLWKQCTNKTNYKYLPEYLALPWLINPIIEDRGAALKNSIKTVMILLKQWRI